MAIYSNPLSLDDIDQITADRQRELLDKAAKRSIGDKSIPVAKAKAFSVGVGGPVASMGARALSVGASAAGMDDAAESLDRSADYYNRATGAWSQASAARNKEIPLPEIVTSGIEGAATQVPALLAASATPAGPLGTLGYIASQAANESITSGRDAGLKGKELAAYAGAKAANEVIVTKVFSKIGGGKFGGAETIAANIMKPAQKAVLKESMRQQAKALGLNLAGETLEELFVETNNQFIEATSGVDETALDPDTLAEVWSQTVAQTIPMVLGMQGVASVSNRIDTQADRRRRYDAAMQKRALGRQPKTQSNVVTQDDVEQDMQDEAETQTIDTVLADLLADDTPKTQGEIVVALKEAGFDVDDPNIAADADAAIDKLIEAGYEYDPDTGQIRKGPSLTGVTQSDDALRQRLLDSGFGPDLVNSLDPEALDTYAAILDRQEAEAAGIPTDEETQTDDVSEVPQTEADASQKGGDSNEEGNQEGRQGGQGLLESEPTTDEGVSAVESQDAAPSPSPETEVDEEEYFDGKMTATDREIDRQLTREGWTKRLYSMFLGDPDGVDDTGFRHSEEIEGVIRETLGFSEKDARDFIGRIRNLAMARQASREKRTVLETLSGSSSSAVEVFNEIPADQQDMLNDAVRDGVVESVTTKSGKTGYRRKGDLQAWLSGRTIKPAQTDPPVSTSPAPVGTAPETQTDAIGEERPGNLPATENIESKEPVERVQTEPDQDGAGKGLVAKAAQAMWDQDDFVRPIDPNTLAKKAGRSLFLIDKESGDQAIASFSSDPEGVILATQGRDYTPRELGLNERLIESLFQQGVGSVYVDVPQRSTPQLMGALSAKGYPVTRNDAKGFKYRVDPKKDTPQAEPTVDPPRLGGKKKPKPAPQDRLAQIRQEAIENLRKQSRRKRTESEIEAEIQSIMREREADARIRQDVRDERRQQQENDARKESKRKLLEQFPGAATNSMLTGDTGQVADDVRRGRLTSDSAIAMANAAVEAGLIPQGKRDQLSKLLSPKPATEATPVVSDEELKQRILDAMMGNEPQAAPVARAQTEPEADVPDNQLSPRGLAKKLQAEKANVTLPDGRSGVIVGDNPPKPAHVNVRYEDGSTEVVSVGDVTRAAVEAKPTRRLGGIKEKIVEKKEESADAYAASKEKLRQKLAGKLLTGIDPEILGAVADVLVQGVRYKAWSFAEIVVDLADTFGSQNIPMLRPYLERGWRAVQAVEKVETPDFDQVFAEYEPSDDSDAISEAIASEPEAIPAYVVSGMQKGPNDIADRRATGRPIGIAVTHIQRGKEKVSSERVIKSVAHHANRGIVVFLDSGMFGVVKNGEIGQEPNWERVFQQYDRVLQYVDEAYRSNVMIVAPDYLEKVPGAIIGDPVRTQELQERYRGKLQEYQDQGVSIIVPVQKDITGERTLSSLAADVTDIVDFGTKRVSFGIPYNAAPYSNEEILEFVEKNKGTGLRLHLLGGGKARAEKLWEQIKAIDPTVYLTGDSATEVRNRDRYPTDPEEVAKVAAPASDTIKAGVLEFAKLKVEKVGSVWQVSGKGTFEHKDLIKSLVNNRAQWDGRSKTWRFRQDPTAAIVDRLTQAGVTAESIPSKESDANVARRNARRIEQERSPDVRRNGESLAESVSTDTKRLIERGKNFGIPDHVRSGQIEDIGAVVDAFSNSRPMAIVGSAPGMGKTFVLGGVIRELRNKGVKKFVYLTKSQELIDQVKTNLAEYGLEGVEFVTYAGIRNNPIDMTGKVLLSDEAHSMKNMAGQTGRAGAQMIRDARFTVFATATPFENVTEAEYMAPSGMFDGITADVKTFKGDVVEVKGFAAWAWMHGADIFFPENGPPVLQWRKRQTEVELQTEANNWLLNRGVYTQRPMSLPPETVKSTMTPVKADQEYVDLYETVVRVYEEAISRAPDQAAKSQIMMHGVNLKKRILEAAKVEAAIAKANKLIAEGKQVILFVNTKADRHIGRYRLSESYAKERGIKGKEKERLYTPIEIDRMMAEHSRQSAMAKKMGDSAGPAPFAKMIHEIAKAMGNNGVDIEMLSVVDELKAGLPQDQVVEFTGRMQLGNAQKGLAEWKKGKKQVIIATMDKGGTGLSFHDTTGTMPERVQLNINLPWSGTQVEQVSGRLARLGTAKQVSLDWLFADNIPFERELTKTVGARLQSMTAAVQGEISDKGEKIFDFDFENQDSMDEPEATDRIQQIQDAFPLNRLQAIAADILSDAMSLPGDVEIALRGTPIPGTENAGVLFQRQTQMPLEIARNLTPAELDGLRSDVVDDIVAHFESFPPDAEFEEAAKAGIAKRGWYRRAAESLSQLFGADAERFVALLAATSPRQGVNENLKQTLTIWKAWNEAGRPTAVKQIDAILEQIPGAMFGSRRPNTISALQGNADLSGFKVNSFAKNLLGNFEEVTNDAWMATFAGIDQKIFGTKAGYLAFNAKIRKTAEKLGMTPAEVQETIWSFTKTLSALRTGGRSSKEALAGMTHESVASMPEFTELIVGNKDVKRLLGQLGLEKVVSRIARQQAARTAEVSGPISPDRPRVLGRIAERIPTGAGGRGAPEAVARSSVSGAAPNTLYQREGIDADTIPTAVLGKMSRRLKAMGYELRGAEDVRRAIKERSLLNYHEDWIAAYKFATGSEQSRQVNAAAKKDLKNVNWARLRQLGTTTDPNEAGYIKPDGTLADLSGKREGGSSGTRSLDHREAGGTGGMQEIMAFGWVRMDENSGSLDIAKLPTSQQLSAIMQMAERQNGELVVDLQDGLGEYSPSNEYYSTPARRWSKEYPKGTSARRIANDIKKFFGGETPNTLYQTAYHGSPHEFSQFTLDHIGTGEGAQAYGWGLYFASKREVADFYRNMLSKPFVSKWNIGTIPLVRIDKDGNANYYDYSPRTSSDRDVVNAGIIENLLINQVDIESAFAEGGVKAAQAKAKQLVEQQRKDWLEEWPDAVKYADNFIQSIDRKFDMVVEQGGKLYQVDLAAKEDEYLLWDRPLSEQSETVKKALKKIVPGDVPSVIRDRIFGAVNADKAMIASYQKQLDDIRSQQSKMADAPQGQFDRKAYDALESKREKIVNALSSEGLFTVGTTDGLKVKADDTNGSWAYRELAKTRRTNEQVADRWASKYLQSLGIRGIKYLDGSSRDNRWTATYDAEGITETYTFDSKDDAESNASWWREQGRDNVRVYRNENESFNYVIFDASDITINEVFYQKQRSQDGAIQAWTHFASASEAIIGATDKADVSSFFHEMGHPMRRFLFNRSVSQEQRGNITDADIGVIEDFVGAKVDNWTVKDEEKFVDALMSYLMEGKAPTKELKPVFQKIAEWLSEIVSVIARRVELTTEVREVFDKVFSRGQISPAKLQAFRDAMAAGVDAKPDVTPAKIPASNTPTINQETASERPADSRQTTEFGATTDRIDFAKISEVGQAGRYGNLVLADGTSQEVQYFIVESEYLTPSHDARNNFSRNEGADDNERPYHDKAQGRSSRETVENIAKASPDKLPLIVSDTPSPTDGPPMVTGNGIVLGGNARTMGVQLAYSRGGEVAGRMKQAMVEAATKFGVDPAKVAAMKEPVVVRVLSKVGERGEMSAILNESLTTGKSRDTTAVSRGKRVSQETASLISSMLRPGPSGEMRSLRDLMSDGTKADRIVLAFKNDGVWSQSEIDQYTDPKTNDLNEDGKTAIEQTLIGRIVNDPTTVGNASKSTKQKLLNALGPLTRAVTSDEHGKRFSEILKTAVESLPGWKASDTPLRQYFMQQQSMFEFAGQGDESVMAMVGAIDGLGPRQFKGAMDAIIQALGIDEGSQGSLFGEASVTSTVDEAIQQEIGESKNKSNVLGAERGESGTRPSEFNPTRRLGSQRQNASIPNISQARMPNPFRRFSNAAAAKAQAKTRTQQGGRLVQAIVKDIDSGSRQVGARSIAEFLNRSFGALMLVTKSQTTVRNPANFNPDGAVIFTRSGTWDVNIHEAGHAMSAMLIDKNPAWYAQHEQDLVAFVQTGLATNASEETAEEGIAELVRMFVIGENLTLPVMQDFIKMLETESSNSMDVLRDAQEAYAIHQARPYMERRAADRNDRAKKTVLGSNQIADAFWGSMNQVIGKSPLIHRNKRMLWKKLAGESGVSMLDPSGVIGSVRLMISSEARRLKNLAKEVMSSLEDTSGDISRAHARQLGAEATKLQAMQGSGLSIYMGRDSLRSLTKRQLKLLKRIGFPLPAKLVGEGELQKITDKSFEQIKEAVGKDWEDFQTAVFDRVALERYRKKGHVYPGMANGITPDMLEQEWKAAFAAHPEWEGHFKDLERFMGQTLLVSYLGGQHSFKEIVDIYTAWDDYAPLQRQVENQPEGRGGSSSTDPNFGVRAAKKGSHLEFRPLEDSVRDRVSKAVDAYHDNLMILSVRDQSVAIGNDHRLNYEVRKDIQRTMIPLRMDPTVKAVVGADMQADIIASGVNRIELDNLGIDHSRMSDAEVANELAAQGMTPYTADDIAIAMPGLPLRVIRGRKRPDLPKVVAPWENGVRKYYYVTDPLTFQLFASSGEVNKVVRGINTMFDGVTAPWKRAYTNTFRFLVRSLFRDPVTAAFISERKREMIPGFLLASAVIGRIRGDQFSREARDAADFMSKALDATSTHDHQGMVKQFMGILGEGIVVKGYSEMPIQEKMLMAPGQAMSLILKPVDMLTYVTGTRWLAKLQESLGREGGYIQERKRGFSPMKAHERFDKATGFFAQRQANKAVAGFLRTAGFLNPALQVMWQCYEAVTHPNPSRRMVLNGTRTAYLAGIGAAASAANLALLFAWYDDDEEKLEEVLKNMRERDEKEKLGNAALFGWFRMPFDYGPAGAIMSASWNATEEYILGVKIDRDKRIREVLKRAAELPGFDDLIPPLAKVGVEQSRNKVFYTDREIVPSYMLDRYADNPQLQYHWDTPELYRWIGSKAGVSPLRIEHGVRGMTTSLYADSIKYIDKHNRGDAKTSDFPLWSGLSTWEATGRQSRSVRSIDELNDEYAAIDIAIRKDTRLPAEAKAELMKRREALSIAHAVSNEISELRDQVRKERDKDEVDYAKIKAIEAKMTTIAADFINNDKIDTSLLQKQFDEALKEVTPYRPQGSQAAKSGFGAPSIPRKPLKTRQADPEAWEKYDKQQEEYPRRVEEFKAQQQKALEFINQYRVRQVDGNVDLESKLRSTLRTMEPPKAPSLRFKGSGYKTQAEWMRAHEEYPVNRDAYLRAREEGNELLRRLSG